MISFNYQAFLSGFWPEYFPIQRLTLTSSCRRPAISLTILTRGARGVEERGGGLSCWVEKGGGGDDNSCLRDISPPCWPPVTATLLRDVMMQKSLSFTIRPGPHTWDAGGGDEQEKYMMRSHAILMVTRFKLTAPSLLMSLPNIASREKMETR